MFTVEERVDIIKEIVPTLGGNGCHLIVDIAFKD